MAFIRFHPLQGPPFVLQLPPAGKGKMAVKVKLGKIL
jgi:hypothetical protein